MISRLKGWNNARATSHSSSSSSSKRRHRSLSQHAETTGVSRSWSNDLTYGTLPTGVDSPSLFRAPWCTRVQHANKRHARPPDTDSIIVPREIKRLPNMWDSCVPARWMFPTTIVPNGKFRPRKP